MSILGIHINKIVWTTTSMGRSFWVKCPWTERPSFKSQDLRKPVSTPPLQPHLLPFPPFALPTHIKRFYWQPTLCKPTYHSCPKNKIPSSLLSVLSNATIASSIFWVFAYQISSPVFKSYSLVHALRAAMKVNFIWVLFTWIGYYYGIPCIYASLRQYIKYFSGSFNVATWRIFWSTLLLFTKIQWAYMLIVNFPSSTNKKCFSCGDVERQDYLV